MGSQSFSTGYVAALVSAFWIWSNPIQAQSLVQDFEHLFERCRIYVETNSAFDSGGLQRRDVADNHARDWGVSSAQTGWFSPGSDLYVVLTEWTSEDGTVRHLCSVRLAEEYFLLGPVDQALLLRRFLLKQVELISAGTHEIDRMLSPIPPVVNAGFLLLDRNPNGCIVSNSFAFSPDGSFFSATSGEKAVERCEAN
jgi:hypothetical protein